MPLSKYLTVKIGDKQIQVTSPEQLPISIDYALEDPDNFQSKPPAQALSVTIPATKLNDIAGNTFRNPDIVDLTDGNVFRGNQPFTIDENGFEIMSGKAFLKSATHNSKPENYEFDFYGTNANWVIDLQEATLYDFLKTINIDFTKENIIASWNFDGTDEALPYVFAPVRYRNPMGGYSNEANDNVKPIDDDYAADYMKPAISKYWILYWAFKSLGYRVVSQFMDSEYFRRQVMPWTWGSFLDSDGTKLDIHRFLAKSVDDQYFSFDKDSSFIWDLKVTNDAESGGFDNNGNYEYDSVNKTMKWTYTGTDNGSLRAHFSMQIQVDAKLNGESSYIKAEANWYKNSVFAGSSTIVDLGGTLIGGRQDNGIKEIDFDQSVVYGDVITVKVTLAGYAAKLGFASIEANVIGFGLDYMRIEIGSTINLSNYTGLQNYNFLDFFRGLVDEFNLSLNTDSKSKIVYIEPTHPWSKDSSQEKFDGYFQNDFIDWNGKEDLSQNWKMENYNDYNLQLTFKYKNDSNDGILKLIQDRHILTLASCKYIFPPRFKTGKTEIENRFFAPTMHYELDQWKSLGTGSNTGISPQMVCMIPENVSNTSNSEAANTFAPKSCYYKGNIEGVGAWKFDGDIYQTYPFMFAVNYKQGGENDPILSYCDENINGTVGHGLLKRFYWQRLAIMRNGQWYNGFFRLKNVDIINNLHRLYISYRGQRWELIQVSGYRPLIEKSTAVLLRKWAPISIEDFNNTFPSNTNVLGGNGVSSYDIKYTQLKCLTTDIPT